MGKDKDISPTKRARIIEMHKNNRSFRSISKEVNCSKSSCERAWNSWNKTGMYTSMPKYGRRRKTDDRTDRLKIRSIGV